MNLRKPGRPRQPYCPDCTKNGIPFVKKRPGQGYCTTCHIKRTKESYTRRMQANDPSYVPRELLRPTLESDIKSALAGGMPLTLDSIKGLYEENGLPVPDDNTLNGIYFPDREPEIVVDRDAAIDSLNRFIEGNPYDPS